MASKIKKNFFSERLNLLARAFSYSVRQSQKQWKFLYVFYRIIRFRNLNLGILFFSRTLLASDLLPTATLSPDVACLKILAQVEQAYNIPPHLLKAIALTESGRQTYKGFHPWPWTINVNGKGYFFESKAEAIQAVKRLQRQGIRSIDVGCMQVNLFHHPHAFRSLDDAFDPTTNIQYGATFLKRLHQSNAGQWKQAAAHYHSANPWHHQPYLHKVLQVWEKERKGPSRKVPLAWQTPSPPPREDHIIDPQINSEESPQITRVPPLRTFKTWKAIQRSPQDLQGSKPQQTAALPVKSPGVQKIPPLHTRYRLSHRPLRPQLLSVKNVQMIR